MLFGSVCSGIEAVTVAWEPLGFRPAWFAETDPFCSALLAHRYRDVENLGDFTAIGGSRGPIDVLAGGTPCQSFSVAGRREGLDDDRGNLAIEFCKLAGRLRPRWLVWENVPGVLSSNGGRDFGTILGTLADLGYGCCWRVLDAQFFGVPQRRRRVFVVGHSGGWRSATAVLLEREGMCRNTPSRRKAPEIVTAVTANSLGTCGGDPKQAQAGHLIPIASTGDISHCLNAGAMGRLDYETETLIAFTAKDYAADAGPVAPTLRAMTHSASHANGGGQVAAVVFESRFARNGRGGPSAVVPPLKARSGETGRGDGAPLLASGLAVRRLTPRECERLQGFEDDYTLIPYRGRLASDGPRYRAIGNSMAVPVMRWIGQRIRFVEAIDG